MFYGCILGNGSQTKDPFPIRVGLLLCVPQAVHEPVAGGDILTNSCVTDSRFAVPERRHFCFSSEKQGSLRTSVPRRKRCGIIKSVQPPNRPLIDDCFPENVASAGGLCYNKPSPSSRCRKRRTVKRKTFFCKRSIVV